MQVEAARSGVTAARAAPNPSVEGTIGRGQSRLGNDSRLEWGVAVEVPLGWLAQRKVKITAAGAEVDVARAEREALRREVLLQLRTQFWNVVYDESRVAALEALEAQTAELVSTVQKRVEAGDVRPVEAIRVEVELEKVRSDLDSARTSLESQRARGALWFGTAKGQPFVAVADLSAPPKAITREDALARLRATHPTIAATRARMRAAEADVAVERAARFPDFSVTGFTTHELDRRAYGGGLTVDVPLWNWNVGRIAQARARLGASRKQAEAAALELEASAIEAQAACRASTQAAARLGSAVVPRSEAAVSIIEKTYRSGEASLLEVIDARRTLLEARTLHLSALAQAQVECSRLDTLIGEQTP
jgi:cobalt-zinc-cadmium efflux system outer membrane protein